MENGAISGYAFSDKEAAPGSSGAAGIGNSVFGGSFGLDEALGRHSVDSGGPVVVRISHPFQHHCSNTSPLPFKSPGGGMATAMGFPFTWAQWKELERQAMVYKYMMASVPVPPELLLAISSNTYPASTAAPVQRGGKNRDLEPGRCKRTDGKKWRCAKEVAPNQKYCERHLHRGRPRSRKPVEDPHHHHHSAASINAAKKNRGVQPALPVQSTESPCSSSLILGSQPRSLDDAKLEQKLSISHFKEPNRNFDWMMMEGEMVAMGGAEEQWQHLLMESRANTRLAFDTSSPLYRRRGEIGFFQLDSNDHHHHNNGSYYDASMAAGSVRNDSPVHCNGTWKSAVPMWAPFESGGPLAEALKPSNQHQHHIDADSISQAGTSSVSSPTGVLQPKAATPFSQSDGSVCNSPTALPPAPPCSDMLPFRWLL
ncbi:hypothetical protein DM860_011001 [Cuscuta australis]|uniref:Growth-regulating factor n=1 Tax=Cuscuta australis TaxID=267555 RepID=A0A328E4H8_9ASTE|nr:hypothetical protein DM860_011001 [Cuscuta australis]